jgi:hypothetical protein
MAGHVLGCNRTPNTYDPVCPRCEEMKAKAERAPRYRGVNATTAVVNAPAESPDNGGAIAVFLFNAFGFLVTVAGIFGALYVVVRFIKWAWSD